MSSIMDICCLCLPNTPFSGNSTRLFHLGNHWSPILRTCGSELEEWVGTRFRPGQTIQHPPETCDLSWANGSLARTLTGTPEKRLSLYLGMKPTQRGAKPRNLFLIPDHLDPPLVFLVMWAEPPLCLIQFELSFKTCKAESWLIPPPSL